MLPGGRSLHFVSLWEWMPVWAAVFLFVITVAVLQRDLYSAHLTYAEMQSHSQVEQYASELLQLTTDAEAGVRGYVLTGHRRFREPYEVALARLPDVRLKYKNSATSIGVDEALSRRFFEAMDSRMESMEKLDAMVSTSRPGSPEVLDAMEVGKARMDMVRSLTADVKVELERKLGNRLNSFYEALQNTISLSIIFGVCSCLLLGIGTWRLKYSMGRTAQLVERLGREEEEYRQLAATLQSNHEESRAAMARRVHDEIGQNLTAAKIDLTLGLRKLAAEEEGARVRMQSAITLIDQTIQIARDISMELRPAILDHVGLHAAMQWQLKQFQSRSGIAVHFVESEDPPGLSRPCKIVLFRVLQEALTNILRHAHAGEVYVRLALEATGVTLIIEDNGAGFDPQRVSGRSLGILGMRERLRSVGGQLELSNTPARGARVVAVVPVRDSIEKENEWHAESS